MSVIGGKSARINSQSTVRNWTISHSADLQAIIASNTKGGTIRLDGNLDWTGSFQAYGHTPSVFPGDLFTFEGSVDGTNGAKSDTSGAIVDSVEIVVDIEAGAPIEYTVNFSAVSALTIGAVEVAADTTNPAAFTSIGCKLNLVNHTPDTPTDADVDEIRTMTLTLSADNKAYVSSSTAGQTKRVAGNIDATFSASVYCADFSTLPQVHDIREIKMYVSATEFWQIKFCEFGELSDMSADIESSDPVAATLNASFSGFALTGTAAPAWTEGAITDPASAKQWAV